MTILFDVDGTLVSYNDKPRWDIIEMVKTLSRYANVYLWSGGGKDYAQMWARKLFLEDYICGYRVKEKDMNVDVCFDDELVDLARVNIKV